MATAIIATTIGLEFLLLYVRARVSAFERGLRK